MTAGETGEIRRHGTKTVSNVEKEKEEAASEVSSGSRSSVKGESEDDEASGYKTRVKLNQNDTANKTVPECGSDRGKISSFESRGRTEWKKSTLVNRSKSVDWRSGENNPDRVRRVDMPEMSTTRGADTCKRTSSLMERKTRVEGGVTGRVTHMSQTLEKGTWGNSLPLRLRSQSGPSCKSSETASSLGVQSGQSIMERIEKLYGSAGLAKMEDLSIRDSSIPETSTDSLISPRQRSYRTAGGTFPRRFSTGDSNTPVNNWMPFIWTQKDTSPSASQTLPFRRKSTTRERSPGTQWHGQTWSRFTDGGGVTWRKGFVESGTRSLDRARSKHTVAAQIRAARAAAGISSPHLPNSLSGEPSVSSKGSFTLRERRASGSKVDSWTIFGEDKNETVGINGLLRERIGKVTEEPKDDGMEEKTYLKGCLIEEVFETDPPEITLTTVERRKIAEKLSTTASVKNKINQFEALTQRGSETNSVPMPRRLFSVPSKLSRGHDGVKKSGSARDIDGRRNKWEGLGEVGSEEKLTRTGKMLGSGRSMSVDEVGLRLERREAGESDVVEEAKNSTSDEFRKYSILKNTLEISLNDGTQRNKRQFFIDETDLSKALSPEEKSESNTPTLQLSVDLSPGDQETSPPEMTPQLSDDDKTPTNAPDHLPFMTPTTQLEIATPSPDSKNKRTLVFTQEANTQDPDTPPLSGPPASCSSSSSSSSSNLPDFIPPFGKTAHPRGRRKLPDLNAWITGLNPEFKGWNYDEDDNEDDDDDDSTQKDDDSNYDSDSGESSITVTSNMSQSNRNSFSLSLSELCNFAGADYDSENDSDDWQSTAGRSISLSSDVSALSCVSVMPAEELDRLLEDVRSLGDNTLQDYNEVQVVVLHKDVGVGLGFSMAGGVDQSKPITVHKVFHSGVAAKEGSIREGDRVLSINGTALERSAHWEAVKALRRAKTREMGVVVLRRDDATGLNRKGLKEKSPGPTQTHHETGQRVCVQLQKNSRNLGFSLEGGADSSEGNRPLTVQKVFLGGPVEKVCSGDEVLEVQGVSVVGMRRLEAWTLIRTLPPGPVDVVLRRPLKSLET